MLWRILLTALLAIPSLYIFKGLRLPGSRYLRLPFPRSLYLWIRSRSRQRIAQREEQLFKAPHQPVEAGSKEEVIKLATEERQKLIEQRERGLVSEERITGLKRAFSTTPLRQLDPITIDEMMVTKTHKGRYLQCRIISRAYGVAKGRFAVQDTKGRAEICEILYPSRKGIPTGKNLDYLFEIGTILRIREPTFRIDSGVPIISISSPTDVDTERQIDECISGTTASYKELNGIILELMSLEQPSVEIEIYTRLLHADLDPAHQSQIYFLRCQAHLALRAFGAAIRDGLKVIRLFDQHDIPDATTVQTNATILVARGYEGLKLFSRAERLYDSCLNMSSTNAGLARDGLSRMKATRSLTSPSLPRIWRTEPRGWTEGCERDWIGPIEVRDLPDREGGRGMIATRDIKPGEVLLVEKAFVWSAGDHFGARTLISGHDLAVDSDLSACTVGLVSNLIDRLRDDPSSLPLVEALYGGPNYPPTSALSWTPIVSRSFDPNGDVASLNLDVSRLENICSFNRFSLPSYREDDPSIHPSQQRADTLFLLASIFNHRCVPNALHDFYRDVMIIRARAPIRQGEEIFISYCPLMEAIKSRDEFFMPIFEGGGCPCDYCKLERSGGLKNAIYRRRIVQEEYIPFRQQVLHSNGQGSQPAMIRAQLLAFLDGLDKTYPPSQGPIRPDLSDIYHILADSHAPVPPNLRSIVTGYRLKGFRSAGAIIEQNGKEVKVIAAPVETHPFSNPVASSLSAACCYLQCTPKDTTPALSWIQAAVDFDRILRGGSYETVNKDYASLIQRLNLGELMKQAQRKYKTAKRK